MIHSPSLSPLSAAPVRRLPRRVAMPAAWPPTLMWLAGVGLCLLVALATLPRTAWSSDAPPPDVPAATALAGTSADGPPAAARRARCANCGVVELIRQLEPVGLLPAEYEFTVRLRDGSARVSTVAAATASAWMAGDAILLIGGI